MKRLLLLPVLMFGLSFACDQPYEEVAGIKIGCPYEGDLSSGYKDDEDDAILHYSESIKGGFFDRAKIKVIDGNIGEVSFIVFSKDHDDIRKSGDALFKALSERWGDADIKQSLDIETIYSFKEMDDSVLHEVVAKRMIVTPVSSLGVIYTSKEMNEHINRKKNERYRQFKEF